MKYKLTFILTVFSIVEFEAYTSIITNSVNTSSTVLTWIVCTVI